MMLKITVGFVISTVVDVITLPVYILIAVTFFKNWKTFNSSYYKLFLFASFMHVINYLNSWPILRLPNIVCKNCTFSDFYKQRSFVGLDTMRFLYVYFAYHLCFVEIIMAFNRYTAIRFHWTYNKIWKKVLIPSIVVALLVPVALAYPSYIYPSYSTYYEAIDTYKYLATEDPLRRGVTLFLVQLIFSISVIVIGAMTLYALCRLPTTPSRSIEVKLFIHSVINSLTMTIISVYAVNQVYTPVALVFQFWYVFFPKVLNIGDRWNLMVIFPSDCIFCISPYALITCSTDLQERMPVISRIIKRNNRSGPASVQPLNF